MDECPECEGGGVELDDIGHQTGELCDYCDGTGQIDRRAIAESIEVDRQVDAMREARAFGDVW